VKILIASPIYADALEHLRKDNDVVTAFDAGSEELIQRIRDREVLVFRSGVDITADVMATAPSLRLLVRAGSGFDNVDVRSPNSVLA
jgi:phosphoglycerate dehydrogenase-like enzyme